MYNAFPVQPRDLVDTVRRAARHHTQAWAELVPSAEVVNLAAEAEEEAAYNAMAQAKRRLRDHITATYGITPGELANLAAI